MKSNNFSGDLDRLLDSAAGAAGRSREDIEQSIGGSAQLSGLLSRLSPEDMQKLQQVLSDPAQARMILATPQAQAMLRSLQSRQKRGTGGGQDGKH